jgi:monoamine oxidase
LYERALAHWTATVAGRVDLTGRIAIVGDGMSGLTAACLLENQGLRETLLIAWREPDPR